MYYGCTKTNYSSHSLNCFCTLVAMETNDRAPCGHRTAMLSDGFSEEQIAVWEFFGRKYGFVFCGQRSVAWIVASDCYVGWRFFGEWQIWHTKHSSELYLFSRGRVVKFLYFGWGVTEKQALWCPVLKGTLFTILWYSSYFNSSPVPDESIIPPPQSITGLQGFIFHLTLKDYHLEYY